MQKVYLVCGVPGSGKSWVCTQLTDKFDYLPHDDFTDFAGALATVAKISQKPILADCPFAERLLREKLEGRSIPVIPIFIIEEPGVVARRYQKREGRSVSKSTLTRAVTIRNRANEWNAFQGNAQEVLDYLRDIELTI